MSWNKLSEDLTVYILSIRKKARNSAAIKIQQFWRNINIQHETLCYLIPKSYIEDNLNGWYTLGNRTLADFLKFTSRYNVLKFKKYIPYWMILYDAIEDQLLKDNLIDNTNKIDNNNYLICEIYFDVLAEKIHNNNYIRLYY